MKTRVKCLYEDLQGCHPPVIGGNKKLLYSTVCLLLALAAYIHYIGNNFDLLPLTEKVPERFTIGFKFNSW